MSELDDAREALLNAQDDNDVATSEAAVAQARADRTLQTLRSARARFGEALIASTLPQDGPRMPPYEWQDETDGAS